MSKLAPNLQRLVDAGNAAIRNGTLKPFSFAKTGKAMQFSAGNPELGGIDASGEANRHELWQACETMSDSEWSAMLKERKAAAKSKIKRSEKAISRMIELIAIDHGKEPWTYGAGPLPDNAGIVEEAHMMQFSIDGSTKTTKPLNAAQARRIVDEQAKTCPTLRNNKTK